MKKLLTLLFVLSVGANAFFIFTSLKAEKGNTVATDIANLQRDFPSPAQCSTYDATIDDASRDAAIGALKSKMGIDPSDMRHYAILSPSLVLQMIQQTPMTPNAVIVVYPAWNANAKSGHEPMSVICRGGVLNGDNSVTFNAGVTNYVPSWCPDLCPAK